MVSLPEERRLQAELRQLDLPGFWLECGIERREKFDMVTVTRYGTMEIGQGPRTRVLTSDSALSR
jgi:hypothetical protein